MKVGIIGTGYVGIVSGVCFADMGHQVVCFDVDQYKLSLYRQGKSAIYEPGLEELLAKNIAAKRIHFTDVITEMIKESDVLFICVGTPPLPDGSADLSQVEAAVREIAENTPAGAYKVIVEKSTVPVGTHKRLKNITRLYNKSQAKFDFVVNSEFLKEGDAIHDFLHPDRIVIGAETEEAKNLMIELYSTFKDKILITDPSSAEIIKYASNSFLATKISFINMVADLCEKTGADVSLVAEGMGLDKRIGRAFLNAGIGYGGSCFPKDVKAFIHVMEQYGIDASILQSVDSFNTQRFHRMIKILKDELWILKNKHIAMWGLAFKPNTDDIREAPSIKIVQELLDAGVILHLYDPAAMENFQKLFPPSDRVHYALSPLEAVENAEALLLVTEWAEFKKIPITKFYEKMKLPVVIDGRNLFPAEDMIKHNFRYFPIGKGKVLETMENNK
ncbi:UDP-glucose dehydrogenase family protein [Thermospira aquatica]|uniref:UDP-glucose 6-dehydrogenase n=1 Tax=Thermospira aquatica TaxID=2828656 RepID=A0AAX3BD15_9SPIR|nr:UDP-glucose/GDP-mannose dehydrogenase family protein [Thermospira aquatica]URA10161.1 UDP-glucose/GDP-mannose dehydrogenase family protein [Thermospira aquatica]